MPLIEVEGELIEIAGLKPAECGCGVCRSLPRLLGREDAHRVRPNSKIEPRSYAEELREVRALVGQLEERLRTIQQLLERALSELEKREAEGVGPCGS